MNESTDMHVAVDGVVFGYEKNNGISILLVKRKFEPYKNQWALPGGFVLNYESLEQAIERELYEETGLQISYLEQLYTFGKPNRDPRYRVISIAYFGLVRTNNFQNLRASTDTIDAQWHSIEALPPLAFDHNIIIDSAIQRLRSKIQYEPIGFELLDRKFPFSDLENLYETLLNQKIDRRNFKKKVMSYNFLEELNEKALSHGKGRPGKLFQFNEEKYKLAQKQGIHFEI